MQKILLSLFTLVFSVVSAQQSDTLISRRILSFEEQVDSLRTVIRLLGGKLMRLKDSTMAGDSEMNEILTLIADEGTDENMPADQLSRRKRVDALLKAIIQRPGQLRLNGGATASLQGNVGDWNHNTSGVGSFDFFAITSFGPHTLLFIDLEGIGGNGLDEIFSTLSGLNEDAGSTQDADGFDRIHVLEAWVELQVLKDMFIITAGKIDLSNYFDNNASANDETTQFISSAFVNGAAFAVPSNSPGLRVRTNLLNRLYVQFALASMDNSGTDLLTDLYRIGSIGFRIFPESEREGNLRFYVYQLPVSADRLGYGLSLDQIIFSGVNIFARYGKNEPKLADEFGISSSWSAGTSFSKQIANHESVLGIGYGEIYPRSGGLKNEGLLEIYIRRQLNKWVHLSPHLQIVWNAAGDSKHITILGFRTQFNF